MQSYLFLCISLILVNRRCALYIEMPTTESTLNLKLTTTQNEESLRKSKSTSSSTESTIIPNTESTLKSSKNRYRTNKLHPKCPENMQSHPWRYVGKYVNCYCKYPFHPLPINNTCFELYKQGPCEPANFLVQPAQIQGYFPLPKCAPNSCLQDGLIPYNGTCHDIITDPFCGYAIPVFIETTSEIQCEVLSVPRSSLTVPLRRKCLTGTRTDRFGRCRKTL